jgi:Zn-finger nucleic acid-binding protein
MELHVLAACPGCGRQFDVSAGGELAGVGPGDRFRCSCGGEVVVPTARAESASVVACSACGGPRRGSKSACGWCGADFTLHELELDAICPRCAARVRRRGGFCHHCALPLTAPDEAVPTEYPCPACAAAPGAVAKRAPGDPAEHAADGAAERPAGGERPRGGATLVSRRVGDDDPLHLFECARCAGLWLDRDVFRALVERARHGRSGLPPERAAAPVAPAAGEWAYRPCPVCSDLMHRRNYGRRSGVILDLCGRHGVWFDHEELTRVLAWVRGGGATEAEVPAPSRQPPPFAGGLFGDSSWGRTGDLGPFGDLGRPYDLGSLLAGVAALLGRALFDRR